MAHRLPEQIIGKIQDAIAAARMERASFDPDPISGDREGTEIEVRTPHGKRVYSQGVTEFIREQTRLYRGSWIVGPLEAILEWSQSTNDGSMKEYDLEGRLTGPWPNPEVLKEAREEVRKLREENAHLRAFRRRVEEATNNLQHAITKKD